jgi:hypothetical protein
MTLKPNTKRRVGRPRCSASPAEVCQLRRQGVALRQIARMLGIGKATVGRLLAREYDPARPHDTSQNSPEASQNSARGSGDGLIAPAGETEAPPLERRQPDIRTRPIDSPTPRLARKIKPDVDFLPGEEPRVCGVCAQRLWRLRQDGRVVCGVCHPIMRAFQDRR